MTLASLSRSCLRLGAELFSSCAGLGFPWFGLTAVRQATGCRILAAPPYLFLNTFLFAWFAKPVAHRTTSLANPSRTPPEKEIMPSFTSVYSHRRKQRKWYQRGTYWGSS